MKLWVNFFFLTQKLQKHLTKQNAFAAFLCLFVCASYLCITIQVTPSSSSPSPPVCLAGGSDSQHPHCVVALFYSPSVSLSFFLFSFSLTLSLWGGKKGMYQHLSFWWGAERFCGQMSIVSVVLRINSHTIIVCVIMIYFACLFSIAVRVLPSYLL